MVLDNASSDLGWEDSLSGEISHRISPFGREVLIQRAIRNTEKFIWAREMRNRIVKNAERWMNLSDDELWGLMFGPKVLRSHFVKPYGGCPECGMEMIKYNKEHPSYPALYAWLYDPWNKPFKLSCPNPNCNAEFPKNDFKKYYDSGIDENGLFDLEKADRSLLYNEEHANPKDPAFLYGVDDGGQHGWNDWRFIAYYFRVARWKEQILGGIDKLSLAYSVTGDIQYAHKAAILLDRVADVYPEMNYFKQGTVYHIEPSAQGYVEYSIDACKNVTTMAIAYGRILGAIQKDKTLVRFLSSQAKKYGQKNKDSIQDILYNIDNNIFRNALNNLNKTKTNPPQQELMKLYCQIVLARSGETCDIFDQISLFFKQWVKRPKKDRYKGLQEYAVSGVDHIGRLLYYMDRFSPKLFNNLIKNNIEILETFDFYIDLWCLNMSYPAEGDGGVLGMRAFFEGPPQSFTKRNIKTSTSQTLFPVYFRLYEITNDERYVQFIYELNGMSVKGLPKDIFADDMESIQNKIKKIINEKGRLKPVSIDKKSYSMVLLQKGVKEKGVALWLDYDAEGMHRHLDGMNFGVFAKGLDIIADLGYPPDMGYGSTITRDWYQLSISHNTVIVDRTTQKEGIGHVTLFKQLPNFGIIKAKGRSLYKQCEKYQRILALIEINEDFYVIDLFVVKGGNEHLKSFHSTFGKLKHNLEVKPSSEIFGEGHILNLHESVSDGEKTEFVWEIYDKYGYLPEAKKVYLHYTELTHYDRVFIGDGELGPGREPKTIPYILFERKKRDKERTLNSVFASVIEAHEGERKVKNISKINFSTINGCVGDSEIIGIRVELTEEITDYFIYTLNEDVENDKEKSGGYMFFSYKEQLKIKPGTYFFRVVKGKPKMIFANGAGISWKKIEM
jgi:succinate dehydrogenase flavin-adding protein (antitoxin of CptAB toxin-antitoxin module)